MGEEWDSISDSLSPTEQVTRFEKLTQDKLNQFCPEKTIKSAFRIKSGLLQNWKKIHRLQKREYIKRGKSEKYKELSKQFKA